MSQIINTALVLGHTCKAKDPPCTLYSYAEPAFMLKQNLGLSPPDLITRRQHGHIYSSLAGELRLLTRPDKVEDLLEKVDMILCSHLVIASHVDFV